MQDITTIKEIIDFALEKEAESKALYENLAKQTNLGRVAAIFKELAEQEEKHYQALEKINVEQLPNLDPDKIPDLKISEYLQEVSYSADMSFQDILVFAMKNEERAHSLYKGLAQHTNDVDLKKLFNFLAAQEATHKLRLETEYDETILKED